MCIYCKKKAVRIVCNVDYQHPSNVLFIELHVLKLYDLIELRTAMIMYKANTGCLPVNLQTMFRMSSEKIHNTCKSSNVRGFAKLKNFQKSKNNLEVGGWVQVPFG